MTKSAKAAADWVLLTRKSAKKVAANGHIRPETRKIPRSEEQGIDLESLDFPGKISAWRTEAHDGQPSGRTTAIRNPEALAFQGFGGCLPGFNPDLTPTNYAISGRLTKRCIHNAQQLFRSIILDLRIDVHSYFTIFMACEVLNRFRVNRGVDQVCDICLP